MARYALTLMPSPETPLWRVGCSILGYDAATGLDAPFPDHPAYHDPLSLAWSAEPRLTGLQAILKAPFELAEHASRAMLEEEVERFASGRTPFAFDLTLTVVGHALALVAAPPSPALQALADDCVRHFEPFRAPLTVEERERRHPEVLIQRQVDNLDAWGSPYVFEDFQFHLPLTGALEPADRHKLEPILRDILEAAMPLRMTADALSLSMQTDTTSRFTLQGRFPFAANPG
jgi:hypothetical protein